MRCQDTIDAANAARAITKASREFSAGPLAQPTDGPPPERVVSEVADRLDLMVRAAVRPGMSNFTPPITKLADLAITGLCFKLSEKTEMLTPDLRALLRAIEPLAPAFTTFQRAKFAAAVEIWSTHQAMVEVRGCFGSVSVVANEILERWRAVGDGLLAFRRDDLPLMVHGVQLCPDCGGLAKDSAPCDADPSVDMTTAWRGGLICQGGCGWFAEEPEPDEDIERFDECSGPCGGGA